MIKAVGALALAAALSGCGATSTSTLQAHNLAAGFIDAVRANDAGTVCSMTTLNARSDLGRLLQRAGAPDGMDPCGETTLASVQVRAAAMRPFLGILGFADHAQSGGSSGDASGSAKAVEWSQSTDGQYALVVVRRHGADGLLVDAIRLQASCGDCK